MRITFFFHTTLKTAKHLAFLNSGATECFISQRFIDWYKLGTHLMTVFWKLQNPDRSPNAGGGLTHYTELEVITSETTHTLHFYIADMGTDDLILHYPWFTATNAHPNWANSTFPTSVIICTKGAASGKPTCSVQVAGMRTTIYNQPFLQQGDELFLHIIKSDPAWATKTTVMQQLAEQAIDKTACT